MNTSVSHFFESVKGKTVAFIGIGTSNLPLIQLFVQKGAKVMALDKKDEASLGENGMLAKQYGATLVAVRESGRVLTSEMEVFFDLCPCQVIAVTGSDGKTTTTTIISEFLKASGKTVHLGGNIGKPLLPEIETVQPDDWAVVELSSFQLISMRKSPDIAVVTNLAPNHLDIHKDMQEYIDAK